MVRAVQQWKRISRDAAIEYIDSGMAAIAAHRAMRTVHPSGPYQEYSWQIYVNQVPGARSVSVDLPASVGYDAATGDESLAEIIVHEMMHVFGAAHIVRLVDYQAEMTQVAIKRPATSMLPEYNSHSRGGNSLTAGGRTKDYPTSRPGLAYLPAMDRDFLASHYPLIDLVDAVHLVPWKPRVSAGSLYFDPLADAGEDITFEYCPQGHTPYGFQHLTVGEVGRLMTGDFSEVDKRLPLLDVWPGGTADPAADFTLQVHDGSLIGYTRSTWAVWDNFAGTEGRQQLEVSRFAPWFTYLQPPEPVCRGCMRMKLPLELVPDADPNAYMEVGLWVAEPHLCGYRCVDVAGQCYWSLDESTFPCCDPNVEEGQ